MDSKEVASLNTLPVELLELVVSFLNVFDVARLQQASGLMRAVCARPFAERLATGSRDVFSVDDDRRCGEPDYGDISITSSGSTLLLRHQQECGQADGSRICVQPTIFALTHSIAHSAPLGAKLTSLIMYGVDILPRQSDTDSRRLNGFRGLYLPHLELLVIRDTVVTVVEDLAVLVRAHARTLQDLCLKRITFYETATVVPDWFALLVYIRDEAVQLERFETAIWQKELYDLTKMLDYRCVQYDEDGKVLGGLMNSWKVKPCIATNGYIISEVKLDADGRIAVREGITAHLARMRRRTRFGRVKKAAGGLLKGRGLSRRI
ncbi:hypothetical protein LTR15_009950 [Elasticomyces elasticus]|nr:hypothetical protein LTR15_009950 [Elasticomyces elasticus]